MSEKRFTYDKPIVAFSKGGINDNVTGETYEFTMDTVLDLLNEQQATICKLQDLCGKSDGENAKLRIENKQLRDYIDTIFEDNTHICKDLDIEDVKFYCDKNKDYRIPSCLYQKCFDEKNLIKIKDEIRRVLE